MGQCWIETVWPDEDMNTVLSTAVKVNTATTARLKKGGRTSKAWSIPNPSGSSSSAEPSAEELAARAQQEELRKQQEQAEDDW